MTMSSNFRIGVGVFLFDQLTEDFILGKRKGGWETGYWALPGGHLEYGETFEQCAAREVYEETGLIINIEDLRVLTAVNDLIDENGLHYISVLMGAVLPQPRLEPQNLEPDKCEGWEWWSWDRLKTLILADIQSKNSANGNESHRMIYSTMIDCVRQHRDFDPQRYYDRH